MSEKYQNRYRINSIRLQNWDYGWNGAYFITICTHKHIHYFGEMINGKMKFSEIGIIANVFWYEITKHAKNIKLGEFVVMPNHIHGILILDNVNDVNDVNVETRHALSPQPSQFPQSSKPPKPSNSSKSSQPQTIGQKRFQNQGKNSISSIIGSYKSVVTKNSNRLGLDFAWQARFYDNIIRNKKAYKNISAYIVNNPKNWNNDKFYNNKI